MIVRLRLGEYRFHRIIFRRNCPVSHHHAVQAESLEVRFVSKIAAIANLWSTGSRIVGERSARLVGVDALIAPIPDETANQVVAAAELLPVTVEVAHCIPHRVRIFCCHYRSVFCICQFHETFPAGIFSPFLLAVVGKTGIIVCIHCARIETRNHIDAGRVGREGGPLLCALVMNQTGRVEILQPSSCSHKIRTEAAFVA